VARFRGWLFLIPYLGLALGGLARGEPSPGQSRGDGDATKPARTDQDGHPLPEGAVARFVNRESIGNKTVYGLGFTPDGHQLMVADATSEVRLWDRSTGKPTRSFAVEDRGVVGDSVLSPDGRLLAAQTMSGPTRGTLHVWDTASGRERWQQETDSLTVSALRFSPDGRTLAAGSKEAVRLWDATTGKEGRVHADHAEWVLCLAFSPDGKLLAWSDRANGIRVSEVNGGRTIQRPGGKEGAGAFSLRFSPDGALLACGLNSQVVVWDTATWKEVLRLGGHEGGVFDLAFTPDCRSLVTACYDKKVRLWEVATGQERCRFEGHRQRVFRTDIAPDGRTVASGSADGEVLLWDVTGLATGRFRRAEPLTAAELEALWGELQGGNGARAYRAVCMLAASPKQAVSFLKDRLRPAAVGTAQVRRLLADLDADTFEVREKASRELAGLGKGAEPDLRRVLAESPSAEVRKRAQALLDRLEREPPPPEWLLALRVSETLEIVGSAEAREVLQALAKGAPGALLTREAKASLERLTKHSASFP
jgi:dipeptidyl aminopeptidase/acylaminoacyl peptidase